MRTNAWAIGAMVLVAALCGCTPSVQVLRQRQARIASEARPDADDLSEDWTALLATFEEPDPRAPLWRVEAMRTLVAEACWLREAGADGGATARLQTVLLREYEQPRFKADQGGPLLPAEARCRVRAWSVHCLGRLDGADAAFFLGVLEDNAGPPDAVYEIRRAALNALVPRAEHLAADRDLRNRALRALSVVDREARRTPGARNAQAVRRIARHLEGELKTYAAVVDLLGAREEMDLSAGVLLDVLAWNYEALQAGAHRQARAAAVWQANQRELLALAWDPREAVRTRARVVLAKFAPRTLLARAAERVEQDQWLGGEDVVMVANLLPPAGSADPLSDADAALRHGAAALVFDRLGRIEPEQREVLYARLLARAPALLAELLGPRTAEAVSETEACALQHLRYLEHLRTHAGSAAQDRRRMDEAIAGCLACRSLEVRGRAVALLADRPLLLGLALAKLLAPGLAQEDPAQADYLVQAYLDVLERMESAAGDGEAYGPQVRAHFGGAHPYDALGAAIATAPVETKGKVVRFLRGRDADRLVVMLATHVGGKGAVDPRTVAMLGDTVAALRAKLADATVAQATAALRARLRAGREEEALLAARYLLEMGLDLSDEPTAGLLPAVQVLLRAAQQAGRQAKGGG